MCLILSARHYLRKFDSITEVSFKIFDTIRSLWNDSVMIELWMASVVVCLYMGHIYGAAEASIEGLVHVSAIASNVRVLP